MTAKLIVYSCVTAGIDLPQNTLLAGEAVQEEGTRYILFSDSLTPCKMRTVGMEWEVQEVKWTHSMCSRRTARYHKCSPHLVLPPHEKSMWIDGNFVFHAINPLTAIVDAYLKDDCSIATFKHSNRQCVYQEENACLKWRKDQKKIIREQVEKYRSEGYPAYNGLVETGCLVRRNDDVAKKFNKTWWAEIEKHSFRDQLSFNYICWKLGLSYNHIEGRIGTSPFFRHIGHSRRR